MRRFVIALILVVLVLSCNVYASDEGIVTVLLKFKNGNLQFQRNVSNFKFDQTGNSLDWHVQNIGTNAHEVITISVDVATNGYSFWRNDTTNANYYVDVGVQGATTNFIAFMRLEPGYIAVLPLHPTNLLYAVGSSETNATDGMELEILIGER